MAASSRPGRLASGGVRRGAAAVLEPPLACGVSVPTTNLVCSSPAAPLEVGRPRVRLWDGAAVARVVQLRAHERLHVGWTRVGGGDACNTASARRTRSADAPGRAGMTFTSTWMLNNHPALSIEMAINAAISHQIRSDSGQGIGFSKPPCSRHCGRSPPQATPPLAKLLHRH